MRFHEFGPGASAGEIRALAPAPRDVEDEVRAIVAQVRRDGDAAVRELTERFDGVRVEELRVPEAEIAAAADRLDRAVRAGLETAIANVGALVDAQLREPVVAELAEGQRIEVVEVPVRRAAAYIPAGRAPYPSTVAMIAVTARAAGVEELVACAPPGDDGAVILGACALCGVSEIYRMGGAQSIAALAYGTGSVRAVDVIAGPGNSYVQEAKRQVAGAVGIDGIAGPSELVVVADGAPDPELIALDLMAQAEHGADGLFVAIAAEADLLSAVRAAVERLAPERSSVTDAPLALVHAQTTEAGLRLAEELAPEHLQLVGPESEAAAPRIRAAGCVFVGAAAGTAFGDYVAGSNHVLPTGGAARFQSALSAATFRRRMARVSLPGEAAAALAPKGAPLARAEGFPVHAESMERRA